MGKSEQGHRRERAMEILCDLHLSHMIEAEFNVNGSGGTSSAVAWKCLETGCVRYFDNKRGYFDWKEGDGAILEDRSRPRCHVHESCLALVRVEGEDLALRCVELGCEAVARWPITPGYSMADEQIRAALKAGTPYLLTRDGFESWQFLDWQEVAGLTIYATAMALYDLTAAKATDPQISLLSFASRKDAVRDLALALSKAGAKNEATGNQ